MIWLLADPADASHVGVKVALAVLAAIAVTVLWLIARRLDVSVVATAVIIVAAFWPLPTALALPSLLAAACAINMWRPAR